jgi:sugar/nucleoside kinase (ribokinase family)
MSLLSVGTVAFDDVETPFGRAEKIVGGACSYIALAASTFVQPSRIVSVVGDDFPAATLKMYEKKGINLEGLQIKKGEKSFFWAGRYHFNMNSRDTLDTQLNVLADFDPIVPESYKDSKYLMLGNLTPQVQMRVLDQMTKRPKLIALDTMNFWMDIALNDLLAVIKKIDVLIINDEEARQLSDEHNLVKASQKILTMGPKYLIVKKGEHGALLFHKSKVFFAPALPLQDVVDPTGAGDTFAGGFMGWIASTGDVSFENMKKAIICGSAMASFCVEQFGIEAIKGLTKAKVEKRMAQFGELVQF